MVTSAWWVYHDQVSKTAPSGEYLTTGMIMYMVINEKFKLLNFLGFARMKKTVIAVGHINKPKDSFNEIPTWS